jgi:type II secretory pathway pseudopilin PulG
MLEMLIVLIVISLLVKITVIKINDIVSHEKINRAAQVVVQDLQNGFGMAGRQRAPVRLTFYPSLKKYVFTDRASGAVYQTRYLTAGADFSVTSLATTAETVDILPNGIGSVAFTVTLTNGSYSRTVTASTAGFIRSKPQ